MNNVFINDTIDELEQDWLKNFLSILAENILDYFELPCPMQPDQKSADGLYINYLHVGKLFVVPQFGLKDDAKALQTMNEVLVKLTELFHALLIELLNMAEC